MCAIGVDGGGTHTRAVLLAPSGEILAWARAGCGNFQSVGLEGLERLLERLLAELGKEIGGRSLALCLGLAGAGRADEQEAIAALVRRRGWAEAVRVVSDARAALEGAHGSGPGIVAISGTGSIVLGKNRAGQEARAGGWGPLLGDEGSGYHIGLEALRAVFRARDGWGPATALGDELLRELGLSHWDEAIRRVYRGDLGRDRIAALGPRVFAAARGGDAVARQIVEAAGRALGYQVGAVARRLGLSDEVELACLGGVFEEGEMLWPALAAAAGKEVANLRPCKPLLPPALGAALLAWGLTGRTVDRELLQSLIAACQRLDLTRNP